MLTFDNVYQAPLDKMKTAADEWAAMKGKLDKLAEDARTTMAAKAKDEYWRGVNAEVTKPFVDKTAKEFDDAAKAADGIHKVLEDGYNAFKKAKDELKKIVDVDAPAKRFRVSSAGKVEAVEPISRTKDQGLRHDPDFQDLIRKENADIDAMQQRIDAIVETCDDADVSCSNALKANITGDRHNFSAPRYTSLDAEEAQRAVDLAKKGRDITHEELTRLNELLKDNSGSKEFSRTFYDGMGPKGALEFFGQLSTDTYDYSKVDKERLADVQELQKNMGLNLATATQGGDAWTDKWSAEMRKLGTERIPLAKYDNNPAYGYQLLGGIMRYGDYDKRFLVPIAEHVTQLHAKDPYLFADSKPMGGWLKNQYNPSGVNGSGFDPMVSMLEALGHSPEASKEFFSKEPTSYNKDGSVGGTVDLDPKKDGNQKGYLDYFQNKDYDFFPDVEGHNPDDWKKSAEYMPDALGHALEAATTGHGWDDPNPQLHRDEKSAEIMKQVIDSYGTNTELREQHKPLMDSLGRMGAAYIDDLNYSTYNFGDSGDALGRDKLFGVSSDGSSRTDFGEGASLRFMNAVAADENGYKTLSAAQQVFEAGGLKALEGDKGSQLTFLHNSTKVHGILDESRIDAISLEFKDQEEAKNLEMEKQAEWRKSAVSGGVAAVVGVGSAVVLGPAAGLVAATAVPILMETVGSAISTDYASDTLQYLKDNEYKNDDEADSAVVDARQEGRRAVVVPSLHVAEMQGMTQTERQELMREIEASYNMGAKSVDDLTANK
ncbi:MULTISPECIES: hypothetical protein [Streptomyces]|uniref:AG2 protein n=1 Tax=Streptomyces venezuelae (strain ATCC 10712 / CBS 650.69 / DSM 40230 / JCM 4526 / NBRC 13096 / PD 04745) TaxID=953739 RepID=F2R4W1_STRVP|nr:hypothetical protein [Streptomyces venezuelae]APE21883.1 hypothetical protein vnz_13220 [Streptomyces venezuelae]QER99277.1 hypothetical protein DEJ43_13385 [Streptomyces venezuelae ATCC 10712]CCA55982.1 hypothetical protein SVEN_2696 [Streptomyces venezuelae ATCC 10712]